jgi:hypothetical protein
MKAYTPDLLSAPDCKHLLLSWPVLRGIFIKPQAENHWKSMLTGLYVVGVNGAFCRDIQRWVLCITSTVQVKVKVTLRLTVSQSVRLGVEPNLGLLTRAFFFFQSYCLVFWGRPLWREIGSVMCKSLSLKSTVVSQYLQQLFTLNSKFTCITNIYNIYRPRSVQALYSRVCPKLVYHGSLRHLNSRTHDGRQV